MSTNVLNSHHKIFEYLCDTKFNSTEDLLSKYTESFSPVYENSDLNFKKIGMFDKYVETKFINDLYKIIEIFVLGIDEDKRQTCFPSIDNNWFLFDKFKFKSLIVELNVKQSDLHLYECCHLFNLIKQTELCGTNLVRISVCFANGFTKFINDLFINDKLQSMLISEYSKKYLHFTFPDFSSKVPVFKNINPPTFANLMSLPSTLHDEPFDYWNFLEIISINTNTIYHLSMRLKLVILNNLTSTAVEVGKWDMFYFMEIQHSSFMQTVEMDVTDILFINLMNTLLKKLYLF